MLPSIVSLEKAFPKGSYHLVGQRYERHTCSEISYRITDVECIERAQTIPRNWMTGRENQCRRILSLSLLRATVPSDEIGSSVQIAKTVQWLETCKNEALRKVLMQLKNGMVVLGLATSHHKKMQARFHPHTVWSSLARTDSDGFLAPCIVRSFTSFQMVHTYIYIYMCQSMQYIKYSPPSPTLLHELN